MAMSTTAAILAHGGQGVAAADAFRWMGEQDRAALLGFLARL